MDTKRHEFGMMVRAVVLVLALNLWVSAHADDSPVPGEWLEPPAIKTGWDDLVEGVVSKEDWEKKRAVLHERFLELLGAAENFAFYVRGQKRAIEHDSRELIYAWMDKYLKSRGESIPKAGR